MGERPSITGGLFGYFAESMLAREAAASCSLDRGDGQTYSEADVEPAPPHNHTRTSIAAADSVRGKADRQREDVYACIVAHPRGITREEIQDALGLDGNSVRPRVWELLGNNGHPARIRETGETRKGRSGRHAEVLAIIRLTLAGTPIG
jgi:hypothetical protein